MASHFDWTEIQAHYDEGHNMRECQARFGFSNGPGTQPSAEAI